jgi:hypothetical protein
LLAAEFQRHLRDGATLVLDAVDELHEPITALAESLEGVFRQRIQVNAYAGWRTSHGFDLHWDDHDVLILQIAGRKRWKVWGMTRKYPLAKDVEPATPPTDAPLWEGLLNDGDLLYIPRGWWHVAIPLDEPTLHLTVGINNPTGADLLAWFVDRLRANEAVRRDLPMFGAPVEKSAAAEELLQAITSTWKSATIDEFLQDQDAKAKVRPHLSLPLAATPGDAAPLHGSERLRWTPARRAAISRDADSGELSFRASGRRWRFAPAAEPILQLLMSQRLCSVDDIQNAAPALNASTIRAFIRELLDAGLVSIAGA